MSSHAFYILVLFLLTLFNQDELFFGSMEPSVKHTEENSLRQAEQGSRAYLLCAVRLQEEFNNEPTDSYRKFH